MNDVEGKPRKAGTGWQYAVAAAAGLALFAIFFWPRETVPPAPVVTGGSGATAAAAGDFATELDLGLAALGRGDNETAIRHFNAAIAANPQSPIGYLDLCIAQLRAAKYLEAMPACDRTVTLAPDNLDARHNLAFANRMIDRAEIAAELLEKVVEQAPARAVSWYELGMAYQALGRHAEARSSFERTLLLDSNHGAARQRLAELPAGAAATPGP